VTAAAPPRSGARARFKARAWITVGLAGLALAGCTQTGDFGRPRPGLASKSLAVTGSISAIVRGEPVSLFPFTDDEQEMRNRAWRFLMPAHERSWFEHTLAELTRTRVLPASVHPADHTAYHDALATEAARSPASRYRRLSEDIQADDRLIEPFSRVAARVAGADRVRLRSLPHVGDLEPGDVAGAVARVAENRCLVAWVRAEWLARSASYRFALEHLVIESPQGQAIPTERALARFEAHLAAAGAAPVALEACAGDAVVPLPTAAVEQVVISK